MRLNTSCFKTFFLICTLTSCICLVLLVFGYRDRERSNLMATTEQGQFQIPDVFQRPDLWRHLGSDIQEGDRLMFQWEWIVNISRSECMQNIKKKKRILLTGLFNLDDYERQVPCHEPGLNFSAYCELVEDFWFDPRYQNYDEFDAVLSRRDWNYQFYEPRIPANVLNFFHIQESPYTLHQGDFRVNHPVLASYWRGSDIVAPYYKWVPHNPPTTNNISRNYAKDKRKLAAIVVSHCPTYNDRLGYVHQLQKYIPVDVYGKCGEYSCESCFGDITRDYKFYLAFENANCRDYITEKLFKNALKNDIVPIVLGAHPDDYKHAAPPHSYIHIEDFPSVKDLGNFLLNLDQNDELYNEYFRWKGTGEIVSGHLDIFCRVCAFLYYSEFHPPPRWPEDAHSWLNVNPCLKPGKHFWLRGE